ncbi:flagellar protofilament ribbon protein [Tritrichomonas foetus]|uniref:Flagellar protofilament ribbon protein n=1 Tax=Tritrichomonas foetus TaxID=1144522 RepID=A0A1J4L2B5_9EUKA|nr:flagellar protofilament ribbon protein [Tritrichomonas foetus]|eukprot:OHT17657.1 flagellar protofilament ribbon protein [Tritrichomonas foetus]
MSPEDKENMRSTQMRQRLLDRKSHILDAHTRRVGLDINTLNEQVVEKQDIHQHVKAREDAFDHQLLTQQELLMEADERQRKQQKMMDQDRDRYRMSQQRPDQSLEYDIWRKDILKVSRPARVGDNDPTLGVSAGQIFNGEDLHISERLKSQARQREEWHNEQKREREAILRKEKIEELEDQVIELETQKKLDENERHSQYVKSQMMQEIANDNYQMMLQKKQNEVNQHNLELQQNDAQFRMNERSRTISEHMASRNEAPMEYRGMTIEEQKAIINEQNNQMLENEKRRMEEEERERQWNEYQEYLRAEGDRNQAMWLRRKQEEQRQLYQTRLQQEAEFKARERYLNKEIYGKNVPDDSFYNSWGNDVR